MARTPTTLHFMAPYQLAIEGFAAARPYWRFEDMMEAVDQLRAGGERFYAYARACDGLPVPLLTISRP